MDSQVPEIIDALAGQGWCVMPEYLPSPVVEDLRAICLARHAAGAFHHAGVGARQAQVVEDVRGDAILWVDTDDQSNAVQAYLNATESLRASVNRELYLGLELLEAHFALYPAGAYYKKHLDRFRDDDRRTLTVIVYLNHAWKMEDGGLLRFWPDPSGTGDSVDILPAGGTLVTFLSERYWHEVLPASRQRLALTGWFKRR